MKKWAKGKRLFIVVCSIIFGFVTVQLDLKYTTMSKWELFKLESFLTLFFLSPFLIYDAMRNHKGVQPTPKKPRIEPQIKKPNAGDDILGAFASVFTTIITIAFILSVIYLLVKFVKWAWVS